MYALVDAVAFYASAEKVFDPSIRNKPVVVLTNNDGCICAICPIARKLSIPKFSPYYKIKPYLQQERVVVRSSNYELYADLSQRMMTTIQRFCDNQHIYSIDESFLHFDGFTNVISSWQEYGQQIRRTIWRETKLPVGVGFGSTATLAKAANHAAKKLPGYKGVAVIDSEQAKKAILEKMDIKDVWAVGERLAKKLKIMGVNTAYQLSRQPSKLIRKNFGVVLERTVCELNGEQCLGWDEVKQRKKEIYSTRAFGQKVTTKSQLHAALAMHCSIVAQKLREQGSLTRCIIVFAHNSQFGKNHFKRSFIYQFAVATNDTTVIANAAASLLSELFVKGVVYAKCGVGALELEDEQYKQDDLFNTSQDNPKLMSILDSINNKYGRDTVKIAASGTCNPTWRMRREYMSNRYTTRWSDIPVFNC